MVARYTSCTDCKLYPRPPFCNQRGSKGTVNSSIACARLCSHGLCDCVHSLRHVIFAMHPSYHVLVQEAVSYARFFTWLPQLMMIPVVDTMLPWTCLVECWCWQQSWSSQVRPMVLLVCPRFRSDVRPKWRQSSPIIRLARRSESPRVFLPWMDCDS
jgi:hypothetical protein